MADEAYWADLRPILQDMADRIARIEQFLATSGPQGPGSGSSFADTGGTGGVFDAVPASFGPPPVFSSPDQIAAASAGISALGPPQIGVVPDDLLMLVRSNRKIQAIAEYRKRTGCTLKQAKDIMDRAERGY